MHMRTALLLSALVSSSFVAADAEIAERHVQDSDLVGKARMKVMFWNVFDASLYAEQGRFDPAEPFVLSLSYLRELEGEKIVEKTIEEMAKQKRFKAQELASWSSQLDTIIDDVDASTTITGVRDSLGNTLFYRNGAPVGEITDVRFTQGFFDIWLGENTSEPKLRRQLLGAKST